MTRTILGILTAVVVGMGSSVSAQNLIGFEAESGSIITSDKVFHDWRVEADTNALGGTNIYTEFNLYSPPDPNADDYLGSIAIYRVTFPAADTYDLYIRVMGPSVRLFYSKSFGYGGPWQTAKKASLKDGAYVWVNLSNIGGNTFAATPGTETFTMMAGARGNRIDAFAFGTAGETFTDAQLNSAVHPPPPAPAGR